MCALFKKIAMEENADENHEYKFVLKKLVENDDTCSIDTDIPSDPWLDDEDIVSSTPNPEFQENKSDNDISYSFLYSKGTDESKIIEEGVDIYSDLLQIEEEVKKSKQKREHEFENCKKELAKLRESDAKKSARIHELTKENTNLQKSICSLYKTVKHEIEHKNYLLTAANRKLDDVLYYKKWQNLRQGKCANCQNYSQDDERDKNSRKRKRSVSSVPSNNKKECEPSTSKDNRDSNLLTDKDKKNRPFFSHVSKSNEKNDKEKQKSDNQCVLYKPPQIDNFSENSRDFTETNNIFFNLLPESLRKSFNEYEQSQIISLNRLKQAFVNEYFHSDTVQSPTLHSTPKQGVRLKQLLLNKNSQNTSVNTASLLDSNSEPYNRTKLVNRFEKNASRNDSREDFAQNVAHEIIENCIITRSDQKDLISLFMYKKEKIPFLEKRKFRLLKDGKNLVPQCLL